MISVIIFPTGPITPNGYGALTLFCRRQPILLHTSSILYSSPGRIPQRDLSYLAFPPLAFSAPKSGRPWTAPQTHRDMTVIWRIIHLLVGRGN